MDVERSIFSAPRQVGPHLTAIALVSATLCFGALIDIATDYAGPHLGFGIVLIAAWAFQWRAVLYAAPGLTALAMLGADPARIAYLVTVLLVGVVIFRFIAESGLWQERSPKRLALGAVIVSGYSAGLAVMVPPFSRYSAEFAESWIRTGMAEFAGFGVCFGVVCLTFRGVF